MRRIWIVLGAGVSLIVIGLLGWTLYEIHSLSTALTDAQWDRISDSLSREDSIAPSVGSIQFIKENAYSIELDRVEYTSNGLHMTGYVGNATNLYVSNLTLTFNATKQVSDMRADFDNADDKTRAVFDWLGVTSIGSAQSQAILSLAPGTKQAFEVTIPNVKQTANGVRITVYFSGERYSYAL